MLAAFYRSQRLFFRFLKYRMLLIRHIIRLIQAENKIPFQKTTDVSIFLADTIVERQI